MAKTLVTMRNIAQINEQIYKDVVLLWNRLAMSLSANLRMAGNKDRELEGVLNLATSHMSQYETEFLHLVSSHYSRISTALTNSLDAADKGRNIDWVAVPEYTKGLAILKGICDKMRSGKISDIKKAGILAYGDKEISKRIGKDIKRFQSRINKIRSRLKIGEEKSTEALKKSMKPR